MWFKLTRIHNMVPSMILVLLGAWVSHGGKESGLGVVVGLNECPTPVAPALSARHTWLVGPCLPPPPPLPTHSPFTHLTHPPFTHPSIPSCNHPPPPPLTTCQAGTGHSLKILHSCMVWVMSLLSAGVAVASVIIND